MPERKFAMVKLGQGDYLCPSNNEKWMCRFWTYEEDGSLVRPDGTAVLGTRWHGARVPMEKFTTLVEKARNDEELLHDPIWWDSIEIDVQRKRSDCADYLLDKD